MEELIELAIFGEINEKDFETAMLMEIVKEKETPFIRANKYGRLNLENLTEGEQT